MGFNNLTVRTKLTLAFGFLAALVLLVSALAVQALSESNERFSKYVNGVNARALLSERVRTAVDRRAIAARNLVLVTKPSDIDLEKAAVTQAHDDVQSRLGKLKALTAQAGDTDARARPGCRHRPH
ncbi:hypothetical protein LMG19083_01653 [Ralstonia psammae]|uniref:Chemotaxis methyl-accepting receptor Tar-related ligand-binding domain-containing protein n=1 Tax=Ralstonia psammae TaxID=3058598 RepID=A0ABM9JAS3_9RALS|nr:hypothetical protein LMG19083_01653 [Ralstonia sp. LMG 19083]